MSAADEVWEVFLQGDRRYDSAQDMAELEHFISQGAVVIEKEKFTPRVTATALEVKIVGPQELEKRAALFLLQREKCELIGFERRFCGGRADILVRHGNLMIAIECGPCRVSKAIDYLREPDTELWIVTSADIFCESFLSFKIKRGPNWASTINERDEGMKAELQRTMSKDLLLG